MENSSNRENKQNTLSRAEVASKDIIALGAKEMLSPEAGRLFVISQINLDGKQKEITEKINEKKINWKQGAKVALIVGSSAAVLFIGIKHRDDIGKFLSNTQKSMGNSEIKHGGKKITTAFESRKMPNMPKKGRQPFSETINIGEKALEMGDWSIMSTPESQRKAALDTLEQIKKLGTIKKDTFVENNAQFEYDHPKQQKAIPLPKPQIPRIK